MNFITLFLILVCAWLYACVDKITQLPTPSAPSIDADTSTYPVCDTLINGTLDCPDLYPPHFIPPASGPRDSPIDSQGRELLLARVQRPQTYGVWSWSESTGTLILCSHLRKYLSEHILLSTPEKGGRAHRKGRYKLKHID